MQHCVGAPVDKHDWSERELYWQALGVDVAAMDKFQIANPVWDPIRNLLEVDAGFMASHANWLEHLEWIFIYAYSWINFSDSRFGKIGPLRQEMGFVLRARD